MSAKNLVIHGCISETMAFWERIKKGERRKEGSAEAPSFLTHVSVIRSLGLLPQCASYIRLKLLSISEAGDHEVAICQVLGTGVWDDVVGKVVVAEVPAKPLDPSLALYSGQLRSEGII
mmetsp:Transcript_29018/g.67321  ORF Transcript_29018/g.67321 Transcript_29018/m.67321 type:complete len:119 (+) Transcript_29018:129-485(+)